jgi:hypothetical protein
MIVPVAIGAEGQLGCREDLSGQKSRTSRSVVENKYSVRFDAGYGLT